jgi:hypothetical protein
MGTSARATTTVSLHTARMAAAAAPPAIARVNLARCLVSSDGVDWFPLDSWIPSRCAPSGPRRHATRQVIAMALGRASAGPPKPPPAGLARVPVRLCAIRLQSATARAPACRPNWSIVRPSFVRQGTAPQRARATRTATTGMPAYSRPVRPAEAAERERMARPAKARTSASPGTAWTASAAKAAAKGRAEAAR